MVLALVIPGLALAACAGQAQTNCAPGLYLYKGKCLDAVGQSFVGCTEDRGNNLSTEDRAKIDASVNSGLQGATGGVDISRKVIETELPDVAMEIVKNCLEVSKNVATPAQQRTIQQQIDSIQDALDRVSQGTISLDPARGPYDQAIRVSGTGWPANIEVEVSAATSRKRTMTTDDGSFQTTIKLDPKFESVSPSTADIRVSPVKASMMLPASALYEIVK
jgi:hypothetical protein